MNDSIHLLFYVLETRTFHLEARRRAKDGTFSDYLAFQSNAARIHHVLDIQINRTYEPISPVDFTRANKLQKDDINR